MRPTALRQSPFATPTALRASPILAFALLSCAVLCAPASAQLGEDEVWFDGPGDVDPAGVPLDVEVAVDGFGRTVVAWEITGSSIYVRRFAHDGTALEDPILVASGGVREPSVAASLDGDFLVVWTETNDTARGTVIDVRSRHYDAAGNEGAEQIVNAQPATFPGAGLLPDVVALTGGGFAVVWMSGIFAGDGDGFTTSIQGRMTTNTGVPSGSQFLVNVVTAGQQSYPRIDGLPADDPDGPYDGGFVAAWTGPDIHLRRFTDSGVGEVGDHQVDGTGNGARIDVAAQQHGERVAVTWQRFPNIVVRVFDGDLNPVAASAEVDNDTGAANADWPTITDIGRDGFYVAWETYYDLGDTPLAGDDVFEDSIHARILDEQGAPAGAQFQVNTWIQGNQARPNVGSSAGRLGIAWQSVGVSDAEPGGSQVVGYLLDYCDLFCDGFESGDTDQWSP